MPSKELTINDMPMDVFEKICENLGDNYQEKYWFTFRHVSKSFRNAVDFWNPSEFRRIGLSSTTRDISILFNGCRVSYIRKSKNSTGIKFHDHDSINQYGNFRDLAVDDLMSVLASPGGYELEKLIISEKIDKRFAQRLSDEFTKLGANVDVNTVQLNPARIMNPIPVNKILNLFRSIEEINISYSQDNDPITQKDIKSIIGKANRIEALKNAGMVKIDRSLMDSDSKLLIPRGLKIPNMTLAYGFLSDKSAFKIVGILLNSPHLKCCRINTSSFLTKMEFDENLKELGAANDPENRNAYKYRIPDFQEFFEIEIKRNNTFITGISIERK
ncbi:hypothetical protein B9Z55_026970 [Caenorhabditis nigoni]|uniref:F-box domain-containing protein n=1 Tax=Caenorhabditis nigoni TaxID=1611254 RepID=A0A2G5SIL7_9PELO|nr:hypothetical protein B9Z55_026970 [Caenorhabditis nigoni]